jgi:hypothetical protein
MSTIAAATSRASSTSRPSLGWSGRNTLGALAFLSLGAIGGAAFMLAAPDGHLMQWDTTMLAGSPFDDFLVPGLILGGLFGLGSLATIGLGLRGSPVAPFVAFAIGCAQLIWITVELAVLGELSFLHPLMFGTGALIAVASVRWGWPTFAAWRAAR